MLGIDQEQFQNNISSMIIVRLMHVYKGINVYYLLIIVATSSEVTSISIHPHFLSHFLVSYSSGHIALYDIRWTHPLITWPSGRQSHLIREVNWHPNLSSVFICVGGDNNVHIW